MKEKVTSPLVWIDCEMTGLNLEIDELCEIAVIVTDAELNPMDEGIDLIIRPSDRARENMNDFVRQMHTNSGLINELDDGISIEDAGKQVLEYVKRFAPEPNKALLAGNSVGTDKTFLQKQLPELVDWLHYRILDVSSLKEMCARWYPRVLVMAPEKTGNHRALGDIQDSINELRYYRAALFPAGEGPGKEELQEVVSRVKADNPFS